MTESQGIIAQILRVLADRLEADDVEGIGVHPHIVSRDALGLVWIHHELYGRIPVGLDVYTVHVTTICAAEPRPAPELRLIATEEEQADD